MAKTVAAIVGRPNVGKSTLFNKIAGTRISIVEDIPGVTRDRIYYETEWNGKPIVLIDTGGIEPKTDDVILEKMKTQAEIAIETADVIVFMTDVKAGLVADFRHEFKLVKCRSVNDLHHAKDAYLNIVAGNVYHCRFTKNFRIEQKYSLKTKEIFTHNVVVNGDTVWKAGESLELVKRMYARNSVHLTQYAFCRKGGLFDQMPLKAAEGLVPRKKGMDTALAEKLKSGKTVDNEEIKYAIKIRMKDSCE